VQSHRSVELLILEKHADTYSDQEETAFNVYYGTIGLHLLVVLDGMTEDFLSECQLKNLDDELHLLMPSMDITQTESFIEDIVYQASSWVKPRKIIIQSVVCPAGDLFFTHAFS